MMTLCFFSRSSDPGWSLDHASMFTPDHSRSSSPTHMGATRLPDWTFAQHELLEKAGYDISKKFEEKEKEFEIKEKLFEMRSVDCGGGGSLLINCQEV